MEIPPGCTSIHGHSRTILHIDADCFYAQVEMLRDPSLVDKPLGIQQKNIVVTCNYNAREYGVRKLMYITDAKKVCPALVLVSGEDLTNYRAMSDKVTELLQSRFSPLVERLGMDENFVDVTKLVEARTQASTVEGHIYDSDTSDDLKIDCPCGCDGRVKTGSEIANAMRRAICEELGLTMCAGVSYNKTLAKIVGSQHKPNQQTTLFSWQAISLISNLQGGVRSIPGIGRQMSETLKSHGICSIQDLQSCSLGHLTKVFGNSDKAQLVQKLAYGIDDSPVKPSGKPKSMGIEDAFKEINNFPKAEDKIKVLATRLLELMINQEEKRQPGNVKLTVRKIELSTKRWKRESRQMPMFPLPSIEGDNFVDSTLLRLMPLLLELFGKIVAIGEIFHLTLLGVAFVNFNEQKSARCSINSFLQPVSKKVKLSEISASSSATANNSCQDQEILPAEVDPEVFNLLPPEVQMELRNEWKSQSYTPKSPQTKKKKSITDYFAKNKS